MLHHAVRNSRDLGPMPKKKLLSRANRPTLQTSVPFGGHIPVAKDATYSLSSIRCYSRGNKGHYPLSLMVINTAQLKVPSSSEVCTASRASLPLVCSPWLHAEHVHHVVQHETFWQVCPTGSQPFSLLLFVQMMCLGLTARQMLSSISAPEASFAPAFASEASSKIETGPGTTDSKGVQHGDDCSSAEDVHIIHGFCHWHLSKHHVPAAEDVFGCQRGCSPFSKPSYKERLHLVLGAI